MTKAPLQFRRRHRPHRVYIPFIAMLKLLFNFDGS
jgi:hypothetical protein